MLLGLFHALGENNRSAEEFVLCRSVKVNILQLRCQILPLLDQFLELIIVALKTLDVFVEGLLCLVDRDLLIVNEFPLLVLKYDACLPPLEVPCLADAVSLCYSRFCELTECPYAGLE